jgi:hypothetical protein
MRCESRDVVSFFAPERLDRRNCDAKELSHLLALASAAALESIASSSVPGLYGPGR